MKVCRECDSNLVGVAIQDFAGEGDLCDACCEEQIESVLASQLGS